MDFGAPTASSFTPLDFSGIISSDHGDADSSLHAAKSPGSDINSNMSSYNDVDAASVGGSRGAGSSGGGFMSGGGADQCLSSGFMYENMNSVEDFQFGMVS